MNIKNYLISFDRLTSNTDYIAGCTDSNYLDPSCSPYCSMLCPKTPVMNEKCLTLLRIIENLYRADIVYNNASRLWACCGTESDNNTVNCLEPTSQEFDDPAPGSLSATFSAGSTASTGVATSSSISSANTQTTAISSLPTSVATTSALPSQTSTSQPSSRGDLSTRAKAGVGIGVSIGAIVVLLGATLLFIRSKRKSQMIQSVTGMPIEHVHESKAWVQELGGQQKPAELNSRPAIHEMYTERS